MHERITSKSFLVKRHIIPPSKLCCHSYGAIETQDYISLHCPQSVEVWTHLFKIMRYYWVMPPSSRVLSSIWPSLVCDIIPRALWFTLLQILICKLWKNRNRVVFKQLAPLTAEDIIFNSFNKIGFFC